MQAEANKTWNTSIRAANPVLQDSLQQAEVAFLTGLMNVQSGSLTDLAINQHYELKQFASPFDVDIAYKQRIYDWHSTDQTPFYTYTLRLPTLVQAAQNAANSPAPRDVFSSYGQKKSADMEPAWLTSSAIVASSYRSADFF